MAWVDIQLQPYISFAPCDDGGELKKKVWKAITSLQYNHRHHRKKAGTKQQRINTCFPVMRNATHNFSQFPSTTTRSEPQKEE